MTKAPPEWCPTQGGTFLAYDPEWLDHGEWKQVPTSVGEDGIPVPERNGGIIGTIGLFGRDQALALAYSYAARHASHGREIKVRAQRYFVKYDIAARKDDEKEEK